MNEPLHIEQQLWNYLDGVTSPEENSEIEKKLMSHPEWKQKYQELLEVHTLLKASELENPSMRFTKNVMEEIARHHIAPATRTYINKKIIWGIGAFFIITIVGFLIYGFGQTDWSSSGGSITEKYIDLSKINYSNFFNNHFVNAFMIVIVVLGLALLDRLLVYKRKQYLKDF
jgi:hypothetical protein